MSVGKESSQLMDQTNDNRKWYDQIQIQNNDEEGVKRNIRSIPYIEGRSVFDQESREYTFIATLEDQEEEISCELMVHDDLSTGLYLFESDGESRYFYVESTIF